MSIQDLNKHVKNVVTGQYRATSCRERRKADGQAYQIVQLDDVTGSISAMVWPSAATTIGVLPVMPCYVEVKGKPRWFNGELILDVHDLRQIEADEIEPGTLLMPKRLCPDVALPALRDVVEFQGLLESPVLKAFAARVLHDEAVVESLLRCPASRRHHHAYEGGLLVHSASPLGLVKTAAEDKLGDDTEGIEVTQVAYLFHDIGKVLSMQATKTTFLRHEFLTAQVLGPHLAWLQRQSFRLASALGYIFDFIDQPREKRRRATFAGADVVVWVDQHNASLAAGRGMEVFDAAPLIQLPVVQVRENRHAKR